METSDVTGSDMLERAELDSLQHVDDGARCGAAGPRQADEERSPIGVVEGAANRLCAACLLTPRAPLISDHE